MIYTVQQELAGVNKWIKNKYLVTTMVCYKAIVCSLFTVLIELEHLYGTTFSSMKPHKIQDAELHFITYKFIFNEQRPFFFQPLTSTYSGCWPHSFSPSS